MGNENEEQPPWMQNEWHEQFEPREETHAIPPDAGVEIERDGTLVIPAGIVADKYHFNNGERQ